LYDGANMAARIEFAPEDAPAWWSDEPPPFRLDLRVVGADLDLTHAIVRGMRHDLDGAREQLAAAQEHARQMESRRLEDELAERAHERALAEQRQSSAIRKDEQTHRANVWTLRVCLGALLVVAGVRAIDLLPFSDEPAAVLAPAPTVATD
jgi:hypothetical protein